MMGSVPAQLPQIKIKQISYRSDFYLPSKGKKKIAAEKLEA